MRIVNIIRTSEGAAWTVPPLTALAARGHDVTVILPDPAGGLGRRLTENGLPVVASAAPMGSARDALNPKSVLRIRRQILDLRPDVVIYQLIQTALVVRFALVGTRIGKVHRVPGPLYLENDGIRFAERFLARADDVIIPGSEYTREKYLRLSYPRNRLFAVSFGAPIPELPSTQERARTRQQWGIPEDAFTVVMMAYFYPPKKAAFRGRGIKGHEDLLRAWITFGREHPDARLVMVGDGWGPGGDDYRAAVLREFAPAVPPGSAMWIDGQTDSRPFYSMADLSVAPSLSEEHGAALAAGAMGVPSIVSDAGGLPETVEDGRSGWIFPAGDSDELLTRLRAAYRAHQRGELAAMGQAARSIMQDRFDSAQGGQRVADIVEAVGKVHSARG